MNKYDLFVISAARQNFKAFAAAMVPDFMFSWHNRLICEKLMKVESGEIKRLMINLPPRSGKSLLSSQLFPSWFLGRNPDKRVICTTYGQDLADSFGRQVRNTLKDNKYQLIFPNTVMADDSSSIKKFATTKGGKYIAVGAQGALTGEGGDCIIIDDPLKNRVDANSIKIRTNLIDWYKSTLYTRLSPTGSIIILQTRWHQEDLSGYLLNSEAENWEIINVPAINENDESYWPDRWSVEKLYDIKRSIGSYEFSALYQQQPTPLDSGFFKTTWFEIVDAAPSKGEIVRAWDRAASVNVKGGDPDYTVGVKILKTKDNVFYILDMVRLRGSPLEVHNAIKNTALQDGPMCKIALEQDPGQAGKVDVDYLIRALSGFNVKAYPVRKDKVTRAASFAAQCEAGNVKMVKGPWNHIMLDELSVFPFGKHDDIIDALSCSFNALTQKNLSIYNLTSL